MRTTYMIERHLKKLGDKPAKPVKPIATQSNKRKEEQKEYKKIVKEILSADDRCKLKVPGTCTGKAQGLHHLRKRVGFLLDKRFLKPACNACNQWVELHPKEAIEKGLALSKFGK